MKSLNVRIDYDEFIKDMTLELAKTGRTVRSESINQGIAPSYFHLKRNKSNMTTPMTVQKVEQFIEKANVDICLQDYIVKE